MTAAFSLENKSAYFTSHEEAVNLLRIADDLWGLDGKLALEPSVGSGVFPIASAGCGYDLRWLTNELHPEHTNFTPDTQEDFLTLPPRKVDMVIGNPPFSGHRILNGQRVTTGMEFIQRSFLWADRVSFTLPLSVLKSKMLSQLPSGVELVAWVDPEQRSYTLAGRGAGSEKIVRTVICFFEKTGFHGYPFDGSPVPGLEWLSKGDSCATHAISGWGSPGVTKTFNGSYGPQRRMNRERWCIITDARIEKILATESFKKFCSKWSSGVPFVNKEEFNWYIRCLLDQWPTRDEQEQMAMTEEVEDVARNAGFSGAFDDEFDDIVGEWATGNITRQEALQQAEELAKVKNFSPA